MNNMEIQRQTTNKYSSSVNRHKIKLIHYQKIKKLNSSPFWKTEFSLKSSKTLRTSRFSALYMVTLLEQLHQCVIFVTPLMHFCLLMIIGFKLVLRTTDDLNTLPFSLKLLKCNQIHFIKSFNGASFIASFGQDDTVCISSDEFTQ